MADPLSLLRQYNINKKEIIERDNQIIFGEFSWPKTVKTNFLAYSSGKDSTEKDYYTLECLLFILKNISLTHPVYVRQAAADNIPVVRRPDRKELLAYLNGDINVCSSIDKSAPLEIPNQVKRSLEQDVPDTTSKKPRLEENQVQKVKEQLAARLDASKTSSVTVDNIKSLSEAMSVEKIAAIKAKRLAKKRTTIKTNEDIGPEYDLKAIIDFDVDDTKTILSRERNWRTRTTILETTGKPFSKNIFAILHGVKAREEGKHRTPAQIQTLTPKSTPVRVQNSVPTQPVVYNRYDQERFIRQKEETEGFKIDTLGTYHGMTLKSVTEGTPIKPIVNNIPKTPSTPITSTQNLPANQFKTPTTPAKRHSRTPIIIIPSGAMSLISMMNAKDILQDLKFVSVDDKLKQGAKRENEVLIQRQRNGITIPYRVIDNPSKLTINDWDRVVAVFVMGPAWQFKGYPWENPVEIFSKICAFHLKYDEMRIDPNVARWAVCVIELSKTKRYLDRAALMVFWEKLDKYILQNKPHLRF